MPANRHGGPVVLVWMDICHKVFPYFSLTTGLQ